MSNIISAAILVHSGNQIISICSNLYVAKGLEAAAQNRDVTTTDVTFIKSHTAPYTGPENRMDRISSAIRHQVLFFCPLYSGLSLVLFSQALVQCAYMPVTCFHTAPQTLRLGASIYCPDLCRQHLLKCSVQTTGCRLLTN